MEQKNAPKTLYVAGDVGILEVGARVSIVGSRKASPEGLRRTSKLASLLADRGIVVVSGQATGSTTSAARRRDADRAAASVPFMPILMLTPTSDNGSYVSLARTVLCSLKVKEPLGHRHVTASQIYDKRRRSLKEGASHDVPIGRGIPWARA